jgi:hypothetical protein
MESNLKIILLKNGNLSDYLIGKVTQLDEEPAVLIEGCYRVLEGGALEQYPLHSSQRDLFLTSEALFTIVDPSEQIADEYKKING